MNRKKVMLLFFAVLVLSSAVTAKMLYDGKRLALTESELGMMCLAGAYPAAAFGNEDYEEKNYENPISMVESGGGGEGTPATLAEGQAETPAPTIVDTAPTNPLVIIYHTHATEAYQPISTGNFRTPAEENSVRDVGTVLTKELEAKGIAVIHDKTLHDAQSYNQSYSRSLETIQNLLAKYPSAKYVIDLHRDAAAYMGNAGKVVTVNGETAATFALVVGQGNENAAALNAFATRVVNKTEDMYPGFGGRIISKSYKYNQYVSDHHLLLEIGNNENNIREVRVCAKYFADVLAEIIKEDTE